MTKFSSGFQKILIIASFGMLLAMIMIASVSLHHIKREIIKFKAQSQKTANQPVAEILKAGIVGETGIKESDEIGESSQNSQLPSVIFNTTGTITDIKNDRLIAKGDGSSFADNISRDLNAIFTSETITIISKIDRYSGTEGLRHLKIGDKILLDGAENIRGKTTFIVGTINLIQQ